jgi:hypothetical protein
MPLTVTRTSPKDIQHRQIILTIDNEPFATLMYGESATRELAPGRHRIKAHNTLVWKTVEFDMVDGDDVRFSVANIAGKWTYPLVSVLGVGPIYLLLERLPAASA